MRFSEPGHRMILIIAKRKMVNRGTPSSWGVSLFKKYVPKPSSLGVHQDYNSWIPYSLIRNYKTVAYEQANQHLDDVLRHEGQEKIFDWKWNFKCD